MEFLKELFNGGALTYDQLASAVKGKGYSVVNAAGGAYVPKPDIDQSLIPGKEAFFGFPGGL